MDPPFKKVRSGTPGREKQIQTFNASVVDKNSNKTVKKLTLNIEISMPENHELVMNNANKKKQQKQEQQEQQQEHYDSESSIPTSNH